jgi:M6 family metalloprotease-like protein
LGFGKNRSSVVNKRFIVTGILMNLRVLLEAVPPAGGRNMVNKKVLLCLAAAVAVGLGTVAVIGGSDILSLNGASGSGVSCASITFGANMGTASAIGSTLTSTDTAMFATNGVTVSSLTVSKAYRKSTRGYSYTTTSASYASRVGTASSAGTLTFNFSSAYTINSARVYAAYYSSSTALTLTTSSFTAGSSQAITNTSLSGVDDAATNTATYYEYTGLAANGTSTSLTLSGKSVAIFKIVLNLSSGSTSSSTPASSSSSSSSSESSSSAASTGTYQLVTSANQFVAGNTYAIGDTGVASTSANFTGNSNKGTYYTTPISGVTINSDLTMTPDSTVEEWMLGGAEGAWTLTSTKRSSNGLLAGASGHASAYVQSGATSYQTWGLSLSGSAVTMTNVDNTTYPYFCYSSTYTSFELSSTATPVYFFVKKNSVTAPALSITPSTLSLTVGEADQTIAVTTDAGATVTATSSDPLIASVTYAAPNVTVHAVGAGNATISISSTSAEGGTATKTCAVSVAAEKVPTLTLSGTSVTIVGDNVTDNSISVSTTNFAGTVTYSVTSSNESVAAGDVESGKLVILSGTAGTTTLTITASDGTTTKTATVAVTVENAAVTSVVVSGTQSVTVGGTVTLTATVSVTGGLATTVTWSSSDATIASVNASGVVSGVKAGSATITATSTVDTSKKGTLTITVTSVTDPIINTATASSIKYEAVEASSDVHVLPSTGTQHMLVLPISITDYSSNATAANLTQIKKTLGADSYTASDTGWQTLKSFYNTSSYGNLNLQVTVASYSSSKSVNGWYNSGLSTSTIISNNDGYESEVATIMSAALADYKSANSTKATEFDTNSDGYIDGVIAIYSAPDLEQHTYTDSNDTFWAFTYQAYTSSGNALTASTTSPVVHKYFWASYDFMKGGSYYNSTSGAGSTKTGSAVKTIAADAHTFIHESGHIMGLDDYYDYGNTVEPVGEIDMMDYNIIDHNPFSKFALGWEKAQVISGTGGSLTLNLAPEASTADQIVILPDVNGWNGSAFDEYVIMDFYTPTGLNELDSQYAYETRPQAMTEVGVRIYHVDARLCLYTSSAGAYTNSITTNTSTYTVVAHSNTPTSSGQTTRNNKDAQFRLLTLLDNAGVTHRSTTASANNASLFQQGDTFSIRGTAVSGFNNFASEIYNTSTGKFNDATYMNYLVSFGAMSNTSASITITYQAQ